MMKAHQRIIREQRAAQAASENLFGNWWEGINTDLSNGVIKRINNITAEKIILEYEWLGTMPQAVRQSYGIYFDGNCAGVLVFAEKPGANLETNNNSVVPKDSLYLARGACVHWAHEHCASYFISGVAKRYFGNCTILAYSDPMAGEIGTIYQALGWHYIGPSSGGPTAVIVDGKMIPLRSFKRDRNYVVGQGLQGVKDAFPNAETFEVVGRKGRYIGIYGTRGFKRHMEKKIKPHALAYPKRAARPVDERAPARVSKAQPLGAAPKPPAKPEQLDMME